jgi:hypothetical protein
MTVRVILKSGVEFSIKCDKFTLTRNGFQQVTGYNIEGITENKPVYLDFEQVAAVVRVFADEKLETDDAPYIVAKAGFLLQAVIMPYDVINQQFVESLQALTRECEFALSEKERREREARDHFTATEPEQFALNVDPDTGEVVEESEVAET